MLLNRAAIAIVFAVSVVGAAATAQSPILSAAEARAELFGVRLSGVHEGMGAPWEECIEPSGRTVYRFAGATLEGRLSIETDGAACFAYADDGFTHRSCYAVRREGSNYRFDRFVTRQVERGVRRCEGGQGYVEAPSLALST
jgi:hypothetical protein